MVMPKHPGKLGFGHMTPNAATPRTVRSMVGVFSRFLNDLFVARQARVVGLIPRVPVATTRRMAVYAAEFSILCTRAHLPEGPRIVFTQVAAIRIEIAVFHGVKVKVVKVTLSRPEVSGERVHLGMARSTSIVALLNGELTL